MKATVSRLFSLLTHILILSQCITTQVQATPTISLLTAGPTDEEVFFLYGHTALRVNDRTEGYDLVYNYGYFSMEQPHFFSNFILGRPLYSLGITSMEAFLNEYSSGGRRVTEQVLNLSEREAKEFARYLNWNAQPENAQYRYNFFYDNCATRPRDLIEQYSGGIEYSIAPQSLPTFRSGAREMSHYNSWYTFGADIALGLRSDRQMTVKDAAYLPDYLMNEMDSATRKDNGQPIVREKHELLPQNIQLKDEPIHYPTLLFILLSIYIAFRYLYGKGEKRDLKILSILLYSVLGLLGIVLWFLAFCSSHPHMFPNWNLLLYHPFWLLAIPVILKKDQFYPTKLQSLVMYLLTGVLIIVSALQLIPIGQKFPEGQIYLCLATILLTLYTLKRKPTFRLMHSH